MTGCGSSASSRLPPLAGIAPALWPQSPMSRSPPRRRAPDRLHRGRGSGREQASSAAGRNEAGPAESVPHEPRRHRHGQRTEPDRRPARRCTPAQTIGLSWLFICASKFHNIHYAIRGSGPVLASFRSGFVRGRVFPAPRLIGGATRPGAGCDRPCPVTARPDPEMSDGKARPARGPASRVGRPPARRRRIAAALRLARGALAGRLSARPEAAGRLGAGGYSAGSVPRRMRSAVGVRLRCENRCA